MKTSLLSLLALIVVLPASAETTEKIAIEVYPYVASLGSNAERVESELLREATRVCGNRKNIAGLVDVKLEMVVSDAPQVNPKGKPGGSDFNAVFIFSYPRVQGTATVVCKK